MNKKDLQFVSQTTSCVNGLCQERKEVGFRDKEGKLQRKVKERKFATNALKSRFQNKVKDAYSLPVVAIVELSKPKTK